MNSNQHFIVEQLVKKNYQSILKILTEQIQDENLSKSLSLTELQRAAVYLKMNNYELAKKDIYSWIQSHPYSFLGYYNAYICQYRSNRDRQALKMLNHSICLLYCQKFLKYKDFGFLKRAQGFNQNLLVYSLMLNYMFQQKKYVDIFEKLANIPRNVFPTYLSEQIKCFIYHKKNNQTMMKVYFEEYLKSKKQSFSEQTRQEQIQNKLQQQAIKEQIYTNLQTFQNLYNEIYATRTLEQQNTNGIYFISQKNQTFNIKQIQLIKESEGFIENLKLQKQIEKEQEFINSSRQSKTEKENGKFTLSQSNRYSQSQDSVESDSLYPVQYQGKRVQIKLLKAELVNDKELLFNMDPYCIIQYGNNHFKSNVHKNGGKNPQWNQFFKAILPSEPADLVVQVYDKQTFKFSDDFVGKGSKILNRYQDIKLQIYDKSQVAGYVYLSISKEKNQW